LKIKEAALRELFEKAGVRDAVIDPIIASPEPYHYRNRLDLALLRMKTTGETTLGFMAENRFHVIGADSCAIARKEISDLIPSLKEPALAKMPKKGRLANVIVKTGDDRRVIWGGVGKRSLEMEEKDYLWTEVRGARVHYALDTFFQANLSILPRVIDALDAMIRWTERTAFLDLYGGVGLFAFAFAKKCAKAVIVESFQPSTSVARYNKKWNRADNVEIVDATVEDGLEPALFLTEGCERTLFVDPPRRGLSPSALEAIAASAERDVFYLSCNPESLARDLALFAERGLRLERAVPLDFFPKTKHLETLAHLRKTSALASASAPASF